MHSASIEADVLRAVPESRPSRVLAWILVVVCAVVVLALGIVPWQQTSAGKGRVIAYAAMDRQQSIEAPVDGRIARWFVQEGAHVQRGDPIADIADNDPEILTRLAAERDAARARVEAAMARVTAIDARLDAMRKSQQSTVVAADQRVRMGRERQTGLERAVQGTRAQEKLAALNYERQKALYAQGLTSKRAVELAEADDMKARTEVDRAEATLTAARNEVGALSADQSKLGNDAFASINDALAARASAQSEIASANAEIARMDVRISRQETQHVTAPADGTVLRVLARQGGEMLKAGEPLALFVPDTADRAVEMWVAGNDINLVHEGRAVRLQFEGWPAVQFSGWPSAAVGTYGGRVAIVDRADDGTGRFRVVIVPDDSVSWPAAVNLRQGTRAGGWVLLGRVSLGYELWRQFNGFPPEWTGVGPEGAASSAKEKKK